MLDIKFDQDKFEKELSSSLQKDLKIVHKSKTYSVVSIIASAKSRYIYNLLLSDPLTYTIELDLPKGDLKPIIDYLNGESLGNLSESTLFLCQAAIELEIEELSNTLLKLFDNQLNFPLAIQFLKQSYIHGLNCPTVLQYISKNLNEKNAQDLYKQLSEAQIDYLFRKEDFASDQIMLVLNSFDFTSKPNHRLTKYIKDSSALVDNPNLNLNTLRYILIKRIFGSNPE